MFSNWLESATIYCSIASGLSFWVRMHTQQKWRMCVRKIDRSKQATTDPTLIVYSQIYKYKCNYIIKSCKVHYIDYCENRNCRDLIPPPSERCNSRVYSFRRPLCHSSELGSYPIFLKFRFRWLSCFLPYILRITQNLMLTVTLVYTHFTHVTLHMCGPLTWRFTLAEPR